jgi:hypothetical protein
LNPEWWGSPLVQEKYQIVKACDKRQQQHNNIIPVIIGATGTITKSIKQYRKSTKSRNYKNNHSGHCTHTSELLM